MKLKSEGSSLPFSFFLSLGIFLTLRRKIFTLKRQTELMEVIDTSALLRGWVCFVVTLPFQDRPLHMFLLFLKWESTPVGEGKPNVLGE